MYVDYNNTTTIKSKYMDASNLEQTQGCILYISPLSVFYFITSLYLHTGCVLGLT